MDFSRRCRCRRCRRGRAATIAVVHAWILDYMNISILVQAKAPNEAPSQWRTTV